MYSIDDFKPYKDGDNVSGPVLVWTKQSGYFFLPNAVDGVLIVGVLK